MQIPRNFLFCLADRPREQAQLLSALALPEIAGVTVHESGASAHGGLFPGLDLVMPHVRPDQLVHALVSSSPVIDGAASIALDGGLWPIPFAPESWAAWLRALGNTMAELNRRGFGAQLHGARFCDATVEPDGGGWGYKVTSKADRTVRYESDWLGVVYTRQALLDAVADVAEGINGLVPGLTISMGIIDPRAGVVRITAAGAIMPRGDKGALATDILEAAAEFMPECTLEVLNNNLCGDASAPWELAWSVAQGVKLGTFGGQTIVTSAHTPPAVVAGWIEDALALGASRMELHQADCTPELMAALAAL